MKRGRNTVSKMRILAVVLLWMGMSVGFPLRAAEGGKEFEFLGQKLDSDYLTMEYKLPYGGMVEVRVFTRDGDLIWQNQYIHPRGENRIRLKAGAFEVGNSYTIQLNYKTDVYTLVVERK